MRRSTTLRRPLILSVSFLAGLSVWTLSGGGPADAQAAAPASAPVTLQTALAAATPPAQGVALAVAAEKVPLPSGALLPGTVPTIADVADAYGRATERFGAVTAIAPPTMVVLNTSPSNPSPFDGMPPGDAFRLLAASLTDAQWRVLTSERGLGMTDLTNDLQRGLFRALFPAGHLTVRPRPDPASIDDLAGMQDIGADSLAQARLRLGRRVQMFLPVVDHPGQGRSVPSPPGAAPIYETPYNDPTDDSDMLYGVRVRAEVPNAPKESQLAWKTPALAAPVSLAGLKTVGDLVSRIGTATHLELYADRLYEGRTLTVAGGTPSAPAGDLLRAVAFCVCGAFRRVGSAYVLTDDVMGLGTRRAILQRFEQSAEIARRGPLQDGDDKVVSSHAVDDLPALDSVTTFTPEEAKTGHENGDFPNPGLVTSLPLSQLTPEQQALARRAKELDDQRQDRMRREEEARGRTDTPEAASTLDGRILLTTEPTLQLVLPSLDGPVMLDNYLGSGFLNMFNPSEAVLSRWFQQKQEEEKQKGIVPPAPRRRVPPPIPDLAALLRSCGGRRAVLAAPHTAHDLDILIGSMKKAGLNELWLPVPPIVTAVGGNATGLPPDLLAEALKATKGSGIAVCPVLSLLVWDPKLRMEDLSLLGETSAQAKAATKRYQDRDDSPEALDGIVNNIASGDVAVSPADPAVGRTLAGAVGRLASTPGVMGLIWRSTETPGYGRLEPSQYGRVDDGLGYTEALRLAFLRRMHTDPVDLDGDLGGRSLKTVVRGFDDNAITAPLSQQWDTFRAQTEAALLRSLYGDAQRGAGRRMPIMVEERRQGADGRYDWFGAWDRPDAPLPALSEDLAYSGSATPQTVAAFAKTQTGTALLRLSVWPTMTASDLAGTLKDSGAGPPWSGFVLDYTTGNPESGDPLKKLLTEGVENR